ncbi:tetratricopeptide repeat protein [Myxococcota bacterium]|nr:tetratricopeptide repeat protein [Myxococcota bacterium]
MTSSVAGSDGSANLDGLHPRSGRGFDSDSKQSIPVPWVVGIFFIALLVRFLHLVYLSDSPFFQFLLGDSETYHRWAQRIVAGNGFGGEIFYQAPLYPYFLAGVYATLGETPWAVRGLQAVLGAGSCALISVAGAGWAGRAAGLCAGLILALYAPAIFFDGIVQKSSLDLFILSGLLALLGTRGHPPRPGLWWAMGLTTGVLALVRENALLLAAVLVVWPLLESGGNRRRGVLVSLAFAAGVASALLPVAARNYVVGGGFHLTTSQLGTNLFIGNNPQATGSYIPLRPGRGSALYEREDAITLAREATGRELTPGEVSQYWTRRAVGWALANPGRWWDLTLRKTVLLLDAVESVDTEDQYTVADTSPPLRIAGAVVHFGTLLPLAVLGTFATWHRRRELALLYVMLLAYAASVVAFYVVARYRFPLVPFLAILAGAGIAGAPKFARRGPRIALVSCVITVTATALISNRTRSSPTLMRAVTHYNLGNAYGAAKAPEEAIAQYSLALTLHPDFRDARHNLANLQTVLGNHEVAKRLYRKNLAIHPADAAAHNNLGSLLHREGHREEALSHYRRAAISDPLYATPHYNMGVEAQERRDPLEASRHFARALQIDPTLQSARRSLALTLYRSGNFSAALPHLITAIQAETPDSELLLITSWILSTHPSPSVRDAEKALEYARRAQPSDRAATARALDVLAAAYAEAGDFSRATQYALQALKAAQHPKGKRAQALQSRLDEYRRKRPHREPEKRAFSPDRVEGHLPANGLEPDDHEPGQGRKPSGSTGEGNRWGNQE